MTELFPTINQQIWVSHANLASTKTNQPRKLFPNPIIRGYEPKISQTQDPYKYPLTQLVREFTYNQVDY